MADKYLDHGLYRTPTTGGTAPPDGYAEDGDGAGTGKASAASVVITCAGFANWVFGTDSVSVAGQTVTTTANPTSDADLASKLAVAINALTTTTISAAVNPATTQTRNLINAVASGAVLTIYTRTGGVAWNSQTCTTTRASAFSTSFPVSFSGATAGCWGYLFNTAALWPQSIAIGSYGFFKNAAGIFAGSYNATTDICHLRSGATGKTITHSATSTITVTRDMTLVCDDGTVWAGDTGPLVVECTGSGAQHFLFQPTTAFIRLASRALGRWIWRNKNTYTLAVMGFYSNTAGFNFLTSKLQWEVSGTNTSQGWVLFYPTYGYTTRHEEFKYIHQPNSMGAIGAAIVNNFNASVVFSEGEFEWTSYTSATAPLITFSSCPGALGSAELGFQSCKFTGSGISSLRLFGAITGSVSYSDYRFWADSCVGVDNVSTVIGIASASPASVAAWVPPCASMSLSNIGPKRATRLETGQGIVDWFPNQNYPTLSATLPDGTDWVWRISWSSSTNAIRQGCPWDALRLTKTNLTAGAKVVAAEMLLKTTPGVPATDIAALTTLVHIALVINYIGVDGQRYSETTFPGFEYLFDSATLVDGIGVGSWTLNSYGVSVASRKLEITTTRGGGVAANSEIEARIMFYLPSPSGATDIFCNPELSIS